MQTPDIQAPDIQASGIFIVAAEPSGDQLGADLATSLQAQNPNITLTAIGGAQMNKVGLPSQMDVGGLAILGFVEGLKAYPFVLQKVSEAVDCIRHANPKIVVLIDSWGFMVRVAKRLKAKGFQGEIVKYVAPQVWAMRSGRAKILARYVDHLLSTQTMDAPYFKAAGLPQTFVGNPVLDNPPAASNQEAFLEAYNLNPSYPIVGFLPGSRPSEIDAVGPAIRQGILHIGRTRPKAQLICIVSDAVEARVKSQLSDTDVTFIAQVDLKKALSVMDAALACSGTITTQLAAAGVPTVVLYKLNPLTFFVAQRLFRPRFISLVNISADMNSDVTDLPLMPEYMQDDIMSESPLEALTAFIDGGPEVERLRQVLINETRRMGAGSEKASDRAARAILEMI